jgi:hypothetical protein
VTFNVSSLQTVVQEARSKISQAVALPPGVFWSSRAAAREADRDELMLTPDWRLR